MCLPMQPNMGGARESLPWGVSPHPISAQDSPKELKGILPLSNLRASCLSYSKALAEVLFSVFGTTHQEPSGENSEV